MDIGDQTRDGRPAVFLVRTTCPRCGDVDIRAKRISLITYRADRHPSAARSRYAFTCPDCDQQVELTAQRETVRRLVLAGVEERIEWCSMDELRSGEWPRPQHPELPPSGLPFEPDDLLTLHELLEADDWFERLAAGAD